MGEKDFLILKEIYKEKNLRTVAKKLYITQPAISYRIRRLEEEIEAKIFILENRKIKFTPQGEVLVRYAEKFLKDISAMKEEVSNMNETISGTLKIGAPHNYAHSKLPKILSNFVQNYPKVKIQLVTLKSPEIMDLVRKDEIHIGIENVGYSWEGEKRVILEENLCLVSNKKIEDFKKLSSTPMIEFTMNSLYKTLLYNWWYENSSSPPLISMRVDSIDTCKKMVAEGLGIAVIPDSFIKADDSIYFENIKSKSGKPIVRKVWANYRKSSFNIEVVKKFLDFL